MKRVKTKLDTLKQKVAKYQSELDRLFRERDRVKEELEGYTRRHSSLDFDSLHTGDRCKLQLIYDYFDSRYPIVFQGGLRNDSRGMKLYYWVYDDPSYLELHLTSTSENICFGGSTSWIAKAETMVDKVELLRRIKKDIGRILKANTKS